MSTELIKELRELLNIYALLPARDQFNVGARHVATQVLAAIDRHEREKGEEDEFGPVDLTNVKPDRWSARMEPVSTITLKEAMRGYKEPPEHEPSEYERAMEEVTNHLDYATSQGFNTTRETYGAVTHLKKAVEALRAELHGMSLSISATEEECARLRAELEQRPTREEVEKEFEKRWLVAIQGLNDIAENEAIRVAREEIAATEVEQIAWTPEPEYRLKPRSEG